MAVVWRLCGACVPAVWRLCGGCTMSYGGGVAVI